MDSDSTGGRIAMQFDTASQNKYDVQPSYIDNLIEVRLNEERNGK